MYTPPTGPELRALLEAWHCSQLQAARLVSVDGRTMRRWVSGESPMPYAALFTLAAHRAGRKIKPDGWRGSLMDGR